MKILNQFAYLLLLQFSITTLFSETVKDRKGAVLADRVKMEQNERWIYNDIEAAFEKAKVQNKPLLVTLRCVPCLACIGMDAEVLLENQRISTLLDQFICVRIINANKLDLSKFQFDYDLSFSVLTFNGDGTLYNRFGSWEHQKDPQNKSTESFESALEGALALHSKYPANQKKLSGKQAKSLPYKTPLDIPGIKGKFREELDWNGQVVRSCVHCHQINDSTRWLERNRRRSLNSQQIYPYPASSILGFVLNEEYPIQVIETKAGSPAQEAGFKPGDIIHEASGQEITSEADFSWVLHHLSSVGDELKIMTQRGKQKGILKINLSEGWKKKSDISRRVGTWPMRAMAFGGMKLEELSPSAKKSMGLSQNELALEAKHVGQYNKHALAKRAGWRKGDILIEIAGDNQRRSEGELIGWILEKQKPGQSLQGIALRSGKKINLKIPVQ